MNNKNTGLIATIAAVVLCGCPGLLSVFWGGIMSVVSFMPNADINIGGSSDPTSALITGLSACCVGILFTAVPIAVWYFTMRKKTQAMDNTSPTE